MAGKVSLKELHGGYGRLGMQVPDDTAHMLSAHSLLDRLVCTGLSSVQHLKQETPSMRYAEGDSRSFRFRYLYCTERWGRKPFARTAAVASLRADAPVQPDRRPALE